MEYSPLKEYVALKTRSTIINTINLIDLDEFDRLVR